MYVNEDFERNTEQLLKFKQTKQKMQTVSLEYSNIHSTIIGNQKQLKPHQTKDSTQWKNIIIYFSYIIHYD